MNFADLWNAEAVAPTQAGAFDQQGANASYAFLEPMVGGQTVTVPTQVYQPTPVQTISVSAPASPASPAAPASKNCAWYDVLCHGSNVASSVGGLVSNGVSTVTGAISGTIEGYFIRAIIVILGFIFVAVGLAMFNPKATVNIATTAAKVIK